MGLVSPICGKPNRPADSDAAKVTGSTRKHENPVPKPILGRVWLRVPYAEKDQAKATGARWDREFKCWYVSSDSTLAGFERWLPKERRS